MLLMFRYDCFDNHQQYVSSFYMLVLQQYVGWFLMAAKLSLLVL